MPSRLFYLEYHPHKKGLHIVGRMANELFHILLFYETEPFIGCFLTGPDTFSLLHKNLFEFPFLKPLSGVFAFEQPGIDGHFPVNKLMGKKVGTLRLHVVVDIAVFVLHGLPVVERHGPPEESFESLSQPVKVIGEVFLQHPPLFEFGFHGRKGTFAIVTANENILYMPSTPKP